MCFAGTLVACTTRDTENVHRPCNNNNNMLQRSLALFNITTHNSKHTQVWHVLYTHQLAQCQLQWWWCFHSSRTVQRECATSIGTYTRRHCHSHCQGHPIPSMSASEILYLVSRPCCDQWRGDTTAYRWHIPCTNNIPGWVPARWP